MALPTSLYVTRPSTATSWTRTWKSASAACIRDNGYFKVVVKEPILKTVDVSTRGLAVAPFRMIGRKHGKATEHHHPHRGGRAVPHGAAGDSQRRPGQGPVAQARISGSHLSAQAGRHLRRIDKIRKAIENYTKLYGVYGYIDFTATPEFDVHDDTKTIDLTFDFDEQKQFFVRRIDFSGTQRRATKSFAANCCSTKATSSTIATGNSACCGSTN